MTGRVIPGPWHGTQRRPGVLPTAAYLAERERLGMPARPGAIIASCPWCNAGPFESCRNRAIDRLARRSHEARQP